MEVSIPEVKLENVQKINLIDGGFTAMEAADIVNDVLKVKINFHRLQRLSISEGDAKDSCEYDRSRIKELLEVQALAEDFFEQARIQGKKLKIKSTIQMQIEE